MFQEEGESERARDLFPNEHEHAVCAPPPIAMPSGGCQGASIHPAAQAAAPNDPPFLPPPDRLAPAAALTALPSPTLLRWEAKSSSSDQ